MTIGRIALTPDQELAHLRRQRDELQAYNTAVLERARRAEAERDEARRQLADELLAAEAERDRLASLYADTRALAQQAQADRDEARASLDALRAAVRTCERAMLGDEGPDLPAAWSALHALLPPEAA